MNNMNHSPEIIQPPPAPRLRAVRNVRVFKNDQYVHIPPLRIDQQMKKRDFTEFSFDYTPHQLQEIDSDDE